MYCFYHWRNRNFSLTKYLSTNNNILLKLNYDKTNNSVNLTVNKSTLSFTMPSSFNGNKIVLWLKENFDTNVTKVKISNYSSTLTIPAVQYNVNQRWKFTTEDGVLNKLMYSPNFYDFDSEQFHKVMLQEKLNGSYIVWGTYGSPYDPLPCGGSARLDGLASPQNPPAANLHKRIK